LNRPATVFQLRDDKIADYRVYADVTPMFAA
jgi:limonene-1,2-epoxide hydrolase